MKTILVLLTILITTSCSIQKRTFNSGYFVTWKTKSIQKNQSNNSRYTDIVNSNDNISDVLSEKTIDEPRLKEDTQELPSNTYSEKLLSKNSEYKNRLQNPKASSVRNSEEKNIRSNKKKNSDKLLPITKANKHIAQHQNGGKLQIVALVLCLLLGLIGVHRFYLGYTGLGVLYLLTLGIFGIGWIIDIILLIIPNGLTPKGKSNYKA